ncbi:MAG TPA: replication-relaxation family protein [Gemmatimonadaceae bacterium]|nr:replication-relaxation family protein [Gemmatimonadaceae bacterium]
MREWYGERTAQRLFGGSVAPDGYGVVRLSDHDPLHVLLELDRGTEPLGRIREKVDAYASAIPRSELADLDPLVLFAEPSPRRAAGVSTALASHDSDGERSPFRVIVWSDGDQERTSTLHQVLAVRDAPS